MKDSCNDPQFALSFASSPADIEAAQRLRYSVFVQELGGNGPRVDHALKIERDTFDTSAKHLILRDKNLPTDQQVVGVYRLMDRQNAAAAGGFSSANEFDLTPLLQRDCPILELGRSCLHPDYRGGNAMHHLWRGLGRYVQETGIKTLFGVASFHGTDLAQLSAPLAYLQSFHLAPEHLRATAYGPDAVTTQAIDSDDIDRKAALLQIPALIKAYLRLGGVVGQGAYVDRDFNTVDVCMIVDVDKMSARQRRIYGEAPK